MEYQLPLTEGGLLRGEIYCRSDGFRCVFSIDVPPWGSGVKKVRLVGADGKQVLLGTLIPEQGRLRLQRTMSLSSLRGAGVERPVVGEVDSGPSTGGWQPLRTFTCQDKEVRELICRLHQGSWRLEGPFLEVRFPWRLDMPVPVTPLFCLSEVREEVWYIRLPKDI